MKNIAAPFGATILRSVVKNALGRTVKFDDLVKRDGFHYKKFTDLPFTGKTTGKTQGSQIAICD